MDAVEVVLWSLLALLGCAMVFAFLHCVVEEYEATHRPDPAGNTRATLEAFPDLTRLDHLCAAAGYKSVPGLSVERLVATGASFGATAENEAEGASPAKKRPVWYRRRKVRMRICVAAALVAVAAIGVLVYVLNIEGVKKSGSYGFEWTERYGTIVECGGKHLMSTRMRYLGRGKYIPVIRYSDDDNAHVLWNYSMVGYNPSVFCMNNTPHLIGSANVEVHLNLLTSSPSTGRISILNLDTLGLFEANVPMDTCFDEMFPQCGLDSKFSMLYWKGHWTAYIRSNPIPGGGGRYVQIIKSYDRCRTWSNFTLIDIEGVHPSKHSNIYFFDAYNVNSTHVGARFPAVFGHAGGIFETYSADSVHWSTPRLVRSAVAYGERTTLHPVGRDHAMRINLHLDSDEVQLFNMYGNGSLSVDTTFATSVIL
tara:strand:- start:3185 stop:4456 length:1272 start_codon:yes stop_codon:yes gene_type:complete